MGLARLSSGDMGTHSPSLAKPPRPLGSPPACWLAPGVLEHSLGAAGRGEKCTHSTTGRCPLRHGEPAPAPARAAASQSTSWGRPGLGAAAEAPVPSLVPALGQEPALQCPLLPFTDPQGLERCSMLRPGGSPGRTPGLGDIAEGYWPRAPCWDPGVLAQPLQGGRVIWGVPGAVRLVPAWRGMSGSLLLLVPNCPSRLLRRWVGAGLRWRLPQCFSLLPSASVVPPGLHSVCCCWDWVPGVPPWGLAPAVVGQLGRAGGWAWRSQPRYPAGLTPQAAPA